MSRGVIVILLSLSGLLYSCKTRKDIPAAPTTRCKLDYKSARTLTGLLKQNQVDYSTFSGKIRATVVIDDKSTDFTIALRMKKDSVIWASISPALGIEVLRFSATRDSIKFIDRINNRFFIGGYDTLNRLLKTEIDLEILQSLLVGNSVEFYEEDEKLRPGIDSCRYLLGTIRKRKLRKVMERGKELREPAQNIWMLDSTFRITRIVFREFESKREFDAHFDNHQKVELPEGQSGPVLVPFTLTYLIKSDKIIKIYLEYVKASANKPQSFPFSIPEGYERMGGK